MAFDKRLFNVIMLGVGFFLTFTAFQTTSCIQKIVTSSIQEDHPEYNVDGYVTFGEIYIIFALTTWIAPSIVSLIGPRLSMAFGAVAYSFYYIQFFFPINIIAYILAAILGLGAGIIWVGQGNYITINSDQQTISRNTGLFWAMLQGSFVFGNVFVTFAFRNKTHIDDKTRIFVFSVLSGVSVAGVLVFVLLRPGVTESGEVVKEESSPIKAFVDSIKLLFTKKMLVFLSTMVYTGVSQTFFSTVYPSCLGFTLLLGSKEIATLHGIVLGCGEIVGGIFFGILGDKTAKKGRSPLILIGFIVSLTSYIIIFINLPNDAPFHDTWSKGIIEPIYALALLCSFLLGLGDSSYNTQVMSLLSEMYKDNSSPAFAIFKCIQSIGCSVAALYAGSLSLYAQMAIIIILLFFGSISFFIVEMYQKREKHQAAE